MYSVNLATSIVDKIDANCKLSIVELSDLESSHGISMHY